MGLAGLLTACEHQIQTTSGSQYLAGYSGPVAPATGSQPAPGADADILAAADVEPQLRFPARAGFAGVCWKNKPNNAGEEPGDDLSGKGFRRISFWARGQAGGEIVEFRAGGIGSFKTRYRDSFDVTAGKIKLSNEWTEHSLYVSNEDLSSVITPFCALFHRVDNPKGATVFLDDIQYRGS